MLALAVIVLSAALSTTGFAARNSSGRLLHVRSLLSSDGVAMMVGGAVRNYASFPPLATVIVVLLGISVADRSGLITALLQRMVLQVSGPSLTFVLSLTAMVGHVAGDAAYVTLIPIGAMAFQAAGRSPLLGCVVAFVSVSAGYDASPLLTSTDVLLSGITTAAANTVDPGLVVSPLSNYFFGLASSLLIAATITVVVETVLARSPGLGHDETAGLKTDAAHAPNEPNNRETRGLWASAAVALGFVVALILVVLPSGSPLRGPGGSLTQSPLITGIALVLGVFFTAVGLAYGLTTGTFTCARDVVAAMSDGVRSLAPTLVLFFAISQFLAYFTWTNIGEIVAIRGAETLTRLGAHEWLVLVGVAAVITVMNLFITSGSALWSLVAPVVVPMLLLTGIPAEATQAVYRVADSATNCITPMSPYFAMALRHLQTYRKTAGIGTLVSLTLPVAGAVWIVWILFFILWHLLGIPFGL